MTRYGRSYGCRDDNTGLVHMGQPHKLNHQWCYAPWCGWIRNQRPASLGTRTDKPLTCLACVALWTLG